MKRDILQSREETDDDDDDDDDVHRWNIIRKNTANRATSSSASSSREPLESLHEIYHRIASSAPNIVRDVIAADDFNPFNPYNPHNPHKPHTSQDYNPQEENQRARRQGRNMLLLLPCLCCLALMTLSRCHRRHQYYSRRRQQELRRQRHQQPHFHYHEAGQHSHFTHELLLDSEKPVGDTIPTNSHNIDSHNDNSHNARSHHSGSHYASSHNANSFDANNLEGENVANYIAAYQKSAKWPISRTNKSKNSNNHLQRSLIEAIPPKSEHGPVVVIQAAHLPKAVPGVDPTVTPPGYPWHRWKRQSGRLVGINASKFISLLSALGRARPKPSDAVTGSLVAVERMILGPGNQLYELEGPSGQPEPRLSGRPNQAKIYLFREGQLWTEDHGVAKNGWKHPDWVSIAQRSFQLARDFEDVYPRLKLLTEGDFPLILDVFDYPWCNDDLVPVFRVNLISQPSLCQFAWPTMSLLYLNQKNNQKLMTSPNQWHHQFQQWEQNYPWEDKINKAVWRGKSTGIRRHGVPFLPRERLVQLMSTFFHSNNDPGEEATPVSAAAVNNDENGTPYAQILDAMFVSKSNGSGNGISMIQEDYMKYKAIIDIDGHAWSARLGKILCYNSVVVKVEPEFSNYWEKELLPWEHYIPVKNDLSDLKDAILFAIDENNMIKVQSIIRNAQNWCQFKNTLDQYAVDLLWTLMAYAEILNETPGFYDAWKNDTDAYELRYQYLEPLRLVRTYSGY